jgi:hypothetical protein
VAFVRFLVHFFGCDYGAAYGQWVPYDFWSGVSGSFLVGAVVFGGTWYFSHTCHGSPRCLRWGKYEAAGGTFKLCRHHHPDLRGRKPHHGDLIERLHGEWKAGVVRDG